MTKRSDAYTCLRDFLMDHMRMSHVYQPVMLKVLIESNGKATLRAIAAACLAHDQAQLEYYEEIIKRMPGRVLQSHGLVEREQEGYRLALPLSDLTQAQRDELIRICDSKVDEYFQRRGARAYDHRRIALGELSGTLRYQVLSRAGFRCELCGAPADEGLALKPSIRTLRQRMRDHFTGNAEGSTLRLTLGCLLSNALNIQLRRVGSGKRHTFTNAGEIVLDSWMAEHARVAWAAVEKPWLVEKRLISIVPLPLNLQDNTHPFVPTLKAIRKAAKDAADALPVVVDNGGPRKKKRAEAGAPSA